MPMDETITRFGDRLVEVAELAIRGNGGVKKEGVYFIRTQRPANLEPMIPQEEKNTRIRAAQIVAIRSDLSGNDPARRMRSAFLATRLELIEEIRKSHAKELERAGNELRKQLSKESKETTAKGKPTEKARMALRLLQRANLTK